MNIEHLRFTLPEIFSLIGVTQCLMVLVYMAFRSGKLSRASLPFVYFLILGIAFALDFGQRFLGGSDGYKFMQWLAWYSGPPLSFLLVIQIVRITRLPDIRHYRVLLFIPAAFLAASAMEAWHGECRLWHVCDSYTSWLALAGFFSGGFSMLAIWTNRDMLKEVLVYREGRDRYWLILALISINTMFLGLTLLDLADIIGANDAAVIRTVLGIGFAYLAMTSLFRIYPPSVRMLAASEPEKEQTLSDHELELALKIEKLLQLEKIYHEPSYTRADLARELKVSETIISKIINLHFQKNFPQLLNEHRVEDAKRLLVQTGAPIKTVAEESGFNSLPSFNRVFRELSGMTPTAYREHGKKQGF